MFSFTYSVPANISRFANQIPKRKRDRITKSIIWMFTRILIIRISFCKVIDCREEENLVFWFGAQFISTLNFILSGWLILFSPDLHFRLAKRVSGQTQSLWLETATRTDVPQRGHSTMDPSNLWISYEDSQLNMNWMHSACLPQAPLHVTPKIGYIDPSVTPLSTHSLPFHLWPTLMEITHTLPQIPNTKLHGDSKHNPSHVPQHTQPYQRPARPFLSNTNKPKLHKSCSTKSKPYSNLQRKNFLCCVVKEKFRHSFVLPKKIYC